MDALFDWIKNTMEKSGWVIWLLLMPIAAVLFVLALATAELGRPAWIPIILWLILFQACQANEKLEAIKDYTGDTSWATRRLMDK